MDLDRVILPTPAESERIVRTMASATDQEFRETWTLDQAAEFLRRCDYDCTPGVLLRFISRGYVSEPPGGRWTALHLHCASASLEGRRRWLSAPSRHDAKKSEARLQIESAQAQGIPVFHDLENSSLEDLLIQFVQTDQRQLREVLYEAVRAKMDQLGFVEE